MCGFRFLHQKTNLFAVLFVHAAVHQHLIAACRSTAYRHFIACLILHLAALLVESLASVSFSQPFSGR